MDVEIKFCGITRADDAREAAALGAAYVGVIFAGGPRLVSVEEALPIVAAAAPARRAGVFAAQTAEEIGVVARTLRLDVVQLHTDCDAGRVKEVRRHFPGEIWAVVRVGKAGVPSAAAPLFDAADAVLLDAMTPGALGGTGLALDWNRIAEELSFVRRGRRLVLAGGLRSENVGAAMAALAPDVVDVSSGVEQSPGVKDPARMRAFRDAVWAAQVSR